MEINNIKPCGYVTQEGYRGRDRQGKWQEYATEQEYREMLEFSAVLDTEMNKIKGHNEKAK